DQPDERKNHIEPTPLAGGLVLFPVIVAAIIIGFHGDTRMPLFLLAVSLIFAVGILDDLKGVHFSTKLAAQAGAAMIMILSQVHINFSNIIYLHKLGIHLSPAANEVASWFVTFLWIVGITNAVNLIDGLDGLASGLSLNAIIGLFAIAFMGSKGGVALFSLILAGGILGFMRYNLHPAKTFLGDSGSLLLGFTISFMAILQSAKTTTFMVLVIPIIFIAIPMVDTIWAFTRRMLKGQHPFEPDREHLHHRLLDLNFTPRQTLGYFYAFSVIMGGSGLWLSQHKSLLVIAISFILLALMVGIVKLMQIFNLHKIIFDVNVKLWAFAIRTKGHDLDHSMGLGAGLAILILLPINLGLA
ncbi:MAG: MraY family glycosyltransferase, partial [bacterium]